MKSIFSLCFIFFLFACGKESDKFIIETGEEYFPLEVGKYWVYQVDSIVFDPVGNGIQKDSSSTFFREEIVEKFQNTEGAEVFRTERYKRKEMTDEWQVTDVFILEKNDQIAYRTENNLRLISMVFPIESNNKWNSTVHFDPNTIFSIAGESVAVYKDMDSKIESTGVSENVSGFDFETITILHENRDDNPFERRYILEKYARNVGLVFREMIILDSQYCNQEPPPTDCRTISWEEKGEKGFILNQVILEHNF